MLIVKGINVTKIFETAFEVGFKRKKKCKS